MERYETFAEASRSMNNQGVIVGNSCFINYKKYQRESVEFIDLKTVAEGTVIEFSGTRFEANYVLLVVQEDGERKVRAWRDIDAADLVCPLENIVSFKAQEDGSFRVERGILRKGDRFAMPYFKYREGANGKETRHPDETREYQWIDAYKRIEILRIKP